jgi:hypothetical protein
MMRYIGFSTGALARQDFRKALSMMADKPVQAVELSALRQDELLPLVGQLDELDLHQFRYIAFHAPSSLDESFEPFAVELLERVYSRGWPIIVHPDAMHNVARWAVLGESLCIENMDKRKEVGRTATALDEFFQILPNAGFCFDMGHARQVDPTMSEAALMLQRFRKRLRQLHVSEVGAQSKHDPLTLEAVLAFQRVSHLVPPDIPVILESRVEESGIREEIENALQSLSSARVLAIAGD